MCKALPHNFDLIREMCPAIIRDKVNDILSMLNNNVNLAISTNQNVRVVYKGGSGRILKKAFSSFNFDESLQKIDTNNNGGFRRSTSTVCLDTLRNHHMKLMAREA